ncbi:MAG: NUDIX domain-containing protein [Actinomycetota bacterium]|nr:NUDIX domain-containing protein [Actinomycetota bacterium]
MSVPENPSVSENVRQTSRALVVTPDDRVLLVRYVERSRGVLLTPGGGIEAGESDHQALRRELFEEVGLRDPDIGPLVWTSTHRHVYGDWAGQTDRIYLVRAEWFEPCPGLGSDALGAEGIDDIRWMHRGELRVSPDPVMPRHLLRVLDRLLPDAPFDHQPDPALRGAA